jgi:hypothetical protein
MDSQQDCIPDSEVILLHNKFSLRWLLQGDHLLKTCECWSYCSVEQVA